MVLRLVTLKKNNSTVVQENVKILCKKTIGNEIPSLVLSRSRENNQDLAATCKFEKESCDIVINNHKVKDFFSYIYF